MPMSLEMAMSVAKPQKFQGYSPLQLALNIDTHSIYRKKRLHSLLYKI